MAKFTKHVGVDTRGRKVVVVFREVPNDAESALVILTESLPPAHHDDLINAISSVTAQAMLDPSEYLFRQLFQDGSNMLNTIHQKGWMVKVPAKSIIMVPSPGVEINLVELNKQLKKINSNVPVADVSADGVLSDKKLAKQYRDQAKTFESESKRLRAEANALDPEPELTLVPATEKKARGRPARVLAV